MTEMNALIQAKADAVNHLTTALNAAIDSGEVENLKQVQGYLKAWAAGVSAMLPSQPAKVGDAVLSEPAIGTTVRDKDGDFWTRAHDGLWSQATGDGVRNGGETWDYIQRWAPLTVVS